MNRIQVKPETVLKTAGEHMDVRYIVANHSRDPRGVRGEEGTWCYYVLVNELMLPPEQFAEFWLPPTGEGWKRSDGWTYPAYDYGSAKFACAEWHGGVTYYEKLGGLDGDVRSVKIGCDYAHYWDEHWSYDFDEVEREAIGTVDSLRRMYAFRRRCKWNGKWLPHEQMLEYGGRLYSPEGYAVAKARL